MKNLMRILLLVFVLTLGLNTGCNKTETNNSSSLTLQSYPSSVYHEWTNIFLETDRYAAFYRPGPAPRALAYMALSAYEACLGGMPDYQSLRYRLVISGLPEIKKDLYWPEVINASYGYLMQKFFENVTFKDKSGNILSTVEILNNIAAKEYELQATYDLEEEDDLIKRSKEHGKAVAEAIWIYSTTDKVGHNGHLNPFPKAVNAQGCEWIPTDPQDADKGLYSQWGEVRRFGLSRSDMDALVAPYGCDSDKNSLIYSQAYETYVLTNQARNNPKGEMEHISEFWSDDRVGWTFSPPARMISVADQIVEKERFNLEKTCVLYAQLSMALSDAAVIAWYNKYKFNVERPITYIRRVIDPNFTIPWLGFTPPFPAYPSGHSTFAFSGMGIIEAFVGSSYPFTDFCHQNRTDFLGTPRSFNSLRDLAIENAFSRLPLGVHYRMDFDSGNFCGILCARKVLQLPWKK
ncbi:MAG: vanadium-dependent haloperoxidase [Saprospiraceae bacterium]|nr:vanadium-dependent haloperoxidase [Candidatus Vicinibacter affinis]MBP6173566.1 vanadium-dependent haloperoxidase [Saprospiraceae bacterium]MBP6522557.1 vanadium-dependent haloperoxidase [Saprospiraceae bacterium]